MNTCMWHGWNLCLIRILGANTVGRISWDECPSYEIHGTLRGDNRRRHSCSAGWRILSREILGYAISTSHVARYMPCREVYLQGLRKYRLGGSIVNRKQFLDNCPWSRVKGKSPNHSVWLEEFPEKYMLSWRRALLQP